MPFGPARSRAEPPRVVAVDSLPPQLAELGLVPVAARTEGGFVPPPLEDLYATSSGCPVARKASRSRSSTRPLTRWTPRR